MDESLGLVEGSYKEVDVQKLIITEHQMAAIKVHAANIQRLMNKWGRLKLSGPMGGIGGGSENVREGSSRTVLDERLFRRVPVFNGDLSRCRGWLFDLLVALGTADRAFANEIRRFMKEKTAHQVSNPKFSIKDWDPDLDEAGTQFNQDFHGKYLGELFWGVGSISRG